MRHAQIDSQGRCVGRTPVSLTEAGRQQAARVPSLLSGIPFATLYSSPSQRALDTVAPLAVALSIPVRQVDAIDEIAMGNWDGRTFDHIRRTFPEQYAERGSRLADYRVPGGESFRDVASRACSFIRSLDDKKGPVLAVTHAGVIRAVLCQLTGHPMNDLFHFKARYLACHVLDVDGGEVAIRALDRTPEEFKSLPNVR